MSHSPLSTNLSFKLTCSGIAWAGWVLAGHEGLAGLGRGAQGPWEWALLVARHISRGFKLATNEGQTANARGGVLGGS